MLDQRPAPAAGDGEGLFGLLVRGGDGDRAGGGGEADHDVAVLGAALARGAVVLRLGVGGAGGDGGAAVRGEHDDALRLGDQEQRLAGTGGGGLHRLGEQLGSGGCGGLGDEQPERGVEQPAVEVSGDGPRVVGLAA